MSIRPLTDPFPGERLLAVAPRPDGGEVTGWRRRLNGFAGRALGADALTREQQQRGGYLALLAQALSPGVVEGLAVALAGSGDAIQIAAGQGLSAQGEDVRLAQALSARLSEVQVFESAAASDTAAGDALLPRRLGRSLGELIAQGVDLPRAQILVLVPATVEAAAAGDPGTPCARDPADDAFLDLRRVDAARLALYPWPTDVLALPAAGARWRNRLAHALFMAEKDLAPNALAPWQAAGVPLGADRLFRHLAGVVRRQPRRGAVGRAAETPRSADSRRRPPDTVGSADAPVRRPSRRRARGIARRLRSRRRVSAPAAGRLVAARRGRFRAGRAAVPAGELDRRRRTDPDRTARHAARRSGDAGRFQHRSGRPRAAPGAGAAERLRAGFAGHRERRCRVLRHPRRPARAARRTTRAARRAARPRGGAGARDRRHAARVPRPGPGRARTRGRLDAAARPTRSGLRHHIRRRRRGGRRRACRAGRAARRRAGQGKLRPRRADAAADRPGDHALYRRAPATRRRRRRQGRVRLRTRASRHPQSAHARARRRAHQCRPDRRVVGARRIGRTRQRADFSAGVRRLENQARRQGVHAAEACRTARRREPVRVARNRQPGVARRLEQPPARGRHHLDPAARNARSLGRRVSAAPSPRFRYRRSVSNRSSPARPLSKPTARRPAAATTRSTPSPASNSTSAGSGFSASPTRRATTSRSIWKNSKRPRTACLPTCSD